MKYFYLIKSFDDDDDDESTQRHHGHDNCWYFYDWRVEIFSGFSFETLNCRRDASVSVRSKRIFVWRNANATVATFNGFFRNSNSNERKLKIFKNTSNLLNSMMKFVRFHWRSPLAVSFFIDDWHFSLSSSQPTSFEMGRDVWDRFATS